MFYGYEPFSSIAEEIRYRNEKAPLLHRHTKEFSSNPLNFAPYAMLTPVATPSQVF
jgi:hypothetical protein